MGNALLLPYVALMQPSPITAEFTRIRSGLIALLSVLVIVSLFFFGGRSPRIESGPVAVATPTTEETPSCETEKDESCERNIEEDFFEVGEPLRGPGPFLVYSTLATGVSEIHALDLGTEEPTSIFLGRSAEVYRASVHNQGASALIQLPDGLFSFLRRGSRLDDRRLPLGKESRSVAASPDDRWVAVATMTADDTRTWATISIHSTGGSRPPRRLISFRTVSDLDGGTLDIFWNSSKSLTIVDSCHCDGGPGFTRTYRLSLGGKLQRLPALDEHNPREPSPRLDGSFFAFDDVPSIDCFEHPQACERAPHTLTVANTRTGSLSSVARRRAQPFGSVRLSPAGSVVVASRDGDNAIEIYDVSRRKRIAHSWYAALGFTPVVWIDETRLIALASSPDLVGDRYTGRLLMITLEPGEVSIEPTTLASGVDLSYLGLVH